MEGIPTEVLLDGAGVPVTPLEVDQHVVRVHEADETAPRARRKGVSQAPIIEQNQKKLSRP